LHGREAQRRNAPIDLIGIGVLVEFTEGRIEKCRNDRGERSSRSRNSPCLGIFGSLSGDRSQNSAVISVPNVARLFSTKSTSTR